MGDRAGGMDERDVEERFASIISQWDSPLPSADGVQAGRAGPEEDEVADADAADARYVEDSGEAGEAGEQSAEDTDEDRAIVPQDDPAPPRPSWINPSPLTIIVPTTAWRAAEPPSADDTDAQRGVSSEEDADDEHFEPPAVRLPPQEDLHFWGAVLGLVAGPLLLLYVAMARPFHSTRWFIASVVLSVAGFALLVLRQPAHRDPTSGDDGARL
ncbi:MAG: hypothetical protein ABIU87_01320 [Ornithinibacter sp.]